MRKRVPAQMVILGVLCFMPAISLAQQQPASPAAQSNPAATTPSTGEAASPCSPIVTESGLAHLRFFRVRTSEAAAFSPTIFVDGRPIAKLGNGRRFSMKVTAGTHSVHTDDKTPGISVDAKANQEYFIRTSEEMGFFKGVSRVALATPEEGSPEYKQQKPVEEGRKLAKELLEEDSDAPSTKPEETKK